MACQYINECPSSSEWCTGPDQDYSRCIPFLISACESREKDGSGWHREAVRQCAAAGEMRIELAAKLEDVHRRIRTCRIQAQKEPDPKVCVNIEVAILELERQAEWLEGLLG